MKKKNRKVITERVLFLDDVEKTMTVRIKSIENRKHGGFINIHDEKKSYPISHHIEVRDLRYTSPRY